MGHEKQARIVLVTGAGSGFGRAIVERLAKAGDRVIGTVRSPERAKALTEEAQKAGSSLRFLPLEITRDEDVQALVAAIEPEGLDVLVHNAGWGVAGAIEEVGADEVGRQFAVNVYGPLALTRRLLPALRARKGRVIFIGSLAGRLSMPFQSHYSATKAAIASFSDALRMELRPLGVKVSCVEPGDFATGFTDARQVVRGAESPYAEKFDACMKTAEKMERGGANPEWVARVVEQLSRQANPPARRPVGNWARTICLLLRLLPDGIRESMVRSTYRV